MEAAAPAERDKLIIRVLADTGMRVGEVVGLRPEDILERNRTTSSASHGAREVTAGCRRSCLTWHAAFAATPTTGVPPTRPTSCSSLSAVVPAGAWRHCRPQASFR